MNKVKNLGYDRWLIYKQPLQESDLCWFSFSRYLQKFIELCTETPKGTNMATVK